VSEQQTTRDFEDDVQRAIRSYAEEGARAFDPGRISAQARGAGAGVRWVPGRTSPLVGLPGLRFALLLVLLGVALAALALVGSRLVAPPAPVPGLLAVAVLDQLFVVDPSTATSEPVTAKTPHDAYPVWSPDGTQIVISQHDGRGTLQLVDADGRNRHPIVDGMTSGAPAAWSPDGGRIAFFGYDYPGGAERGLYVVGADGTGLTKLVPQAEGWYGRLAWSPDASMIAYAASDPERPVDGSRGYVYVVDVASGNVTPVSTSHVEVLQDAPLAWRPGRMELLYAQQYKQFGELGHEDVVLAERVGDSWRERPLVTGLRRSAVTVPMWLDVDRFAYVRDNRLWVAGADGRPELPIGEPALNPSGAGCVAPDGSAVAVPAANDETPDGDAPAMTALVLVPTNGGPTIRVDTGWIDMAAPACSWQALRR
jgi:dipeptidyl aminopeptidase/acylaminoacyl peptidase